mgnify:CR=1 FL=1
MRKLLLVIVFLQYLFSANALSQSIIVNDASDPESSYSAEQLLTDVLLDGGLCSTSSNFQLKDNPSEQFPSANRSWGFFKRGNTDFPFERGIVLTTGYAKDAEGPNSGNVSKGDMSWTGDSDATQLAGNSTNNVTIFEFDFVPQANEISFNYIFASEEYPGFACSSYNDVFGFIISGPGITPDPGLSGKNIALLPNGLPVTINNVNDSYCGDDTYYVGGPFQDIEYGGRTVALTAHSEVIPGETYHIRLIVADTTDYLYDSAVFLEAGSFNLGSVIVDENGMDLGNDLEVCGQDEYTLYVSVDDPNFTLQWYKDGNIIPGATEDSLVVTESGVYKVEVANQDCTAEDSIEITFGELETNADTFILEEIDFDGDGFETFDLTEIEPLVVDNYEEMTYDYYSTIEDAENQNNPIADPTAFVASDNTVVYARVADSVACSKIVQIILKVKEDCIYPEAACPGPEFGANIPFLGDGEIPTSAPSGPNYGCLYNQPYPRFYFFKIAESGDLYFDLNQYTQPDQEGSPIDVDFIVWGPFIEVPCNYEDLQEIVDCSYSASAFEYVSIENAQQGEFYVMMITNYAGSYNQYGYVNLIFDEENSTGSFDCSIVSGERNYFACDDEQNGFVVFDLEDVADDIREGDDTLGVKFYSAEEDAVEDTENNVIPTGPFTVNQADTPVEIYAQIKDVTGQVIQVVKVTFEIYEGVTGANDAYFFTCDIGGDGFEFVDLTAIDVIADPENYEISYYETLDDATSGNMAFIPNPTNYEAESGIVYVRIENENGCFTVVQIELEISGLEVDLGEPFSMCEGNIELFADGDFSGYTDVQFTWTRNGTVIEGANEQTLNITGPGTYRVTVTTAEGCEGSDVIVVTPGEPAIITDITVGPDYVIVEAEGGETPYQYSTTGVVWQDSNRFNYLPAGIHTMYVKTAEGCITTQQFAVLAIPTMFTPNGDGINDTWNIPGLEIYPGSEVVIYDRSGRLVYQAELTSNVIWDGYFMNGQKAPTTDYWYIINVTDGRKLTGHITVKSRGEKY